MRLLFTIITCFYFTKINSQEVKPALETLIEFPKIRDFTMSFDKNEMYVTAQSNLEERSIILQIIKEDNGNASVNIASFSGVYKDLEPFLSPDNLKLYFVSNRPIQPNSDEPKDFDIWEVERDSIKGDWSLPRNIGSPINTVHNEFYPSVANNGNLYFTSDAPSSVGEDDIYMSKFENGAYTTPINLKGDVNTKSYEYNAFIAPDESYLLFGGYGRSDGYGSGDLYISFKDEKDIWGAVKNLGPLINSKYMDFCPFIADGKSLYFTSRRSNLTTSKKLDTVKSLIDKFNSYQNGLSRIYKVPLNIEDYKN